MPSRGIARLEAKPPAKARPILISQPLLEIACLAIERVGDDAALHDQAVVLLAGGALDVGQRIAAVRAVRAVEVNALIESFLTRLSKDNPKALARELNEKYTLDLASSYFERVRLARCSESLQQAVENRDLVEARKALTEYQTFDFSSTAWNDPFTEDSINQTLKYYAENRSLIQFPGALNSFLSPYFERDGFVAFQAPEKRGKSYWLMECVYLALKQKRKVLYYGLGDMSQTQYNRRLYSRVTRLPWKPGEVRTPIS